MQARPIYHKFYRTHNRISRFSQIHRSFSQTDRCRMFRLQILRLIKGNSCIRPMPSQRLQKRSQNIIKNYQNNKKAIRRNSLFMAKSCQMQSYRALSRCPCNSSEISRPNQARVNRSKDIITVICICTPKKSPPAQSRAASFHFSSNISTHQLMHKCSTQMQRWPNVFGSGLGPTPYTQTWIWTSTWTWTWTWTSWDAQPFSWTCSFCEDSA